MAERNEDDQLSKLHSQLIGQFSSPNELSTHNLDPAFKELLKKLKGTEERKQLDTILREMNQALCNIDSLKRRLVRERSTDKLLIELEDYRDDIVEIRKEVIDCMKLHTELYFMKEDVIKLIKDFKDSNLSDSLFLIVAEFFSGITSDISPEVLDTILGFSEDIMTVGVYTSVGGVVVGCLGVCAFVAGKILLHAGAFIAKDGMGAIGQGMAAIMGKAAAMKGMIIAGEGIISTIGTAIAGLPAAIKVVMAATSGVVTCVKAVGNGAVVLGKVALVLSPVAIKVGVVIVGIGAIILLVGGVCWFSVYLYKKWVNKKIQKEMLNDIRKKRQDLEKRNILAQLKTFKDEFNSQRDALKASTGAQSYVDLNLLMKCYKGYKRALERALNNPSNKFTEEQLRDMFAFEHSEPLKDRYNLSDSKAKELILVIHKSVTRNQPNDS